MSDPALSAVIVSWNSGNALAACVEALRASAGEEGAEIEVVLVDNASTDGAADTVEADVAIRNPVNAGFAVAASQGLALTSAPWVLLLNPDVTVSSPFVRELLAAAAQAPADVAALVPELRFASDPEVVNCRGVEVDADGIPAEVDAGLASEPVPAPRSVFGASGGAGLLRAQALRQVGGLEPVYFAYLEDVDLAWRLQRAGYRAELVPGAVAYHAGSVSVREGSPLKTLLVARNRRILFRLNGPRDLRARGSRTVTELGHAVVSSAGGTWSEPWRGRLGALRLRRYTGFLLESRALVDRRVAEPALAPRSGFGQALRRKRAFARSARAR